MAISDLLRRCRMELFRRQVIILVTLFNAREPVSGVVLSQKSGLSLNTLKKEIDDLNHNCSGFGFEILSKTGSGYEISITDRSKFFPYRRQIQSRFYRNLFFRDSQTDRVHFIIRHMLSNESLFVDDIADECFCSVSTINRDMRAVKTRLERKGLKIVNHTNRGMKLEGSEWNLRLAFVDEYHIYQDFESAYHFQEDSFERLMLEGTAARSNIEKSVRSVLQQFHYPLSYNSIRDFNNLMVLTITRQKFLDSLLIDQEKFEKLDAALEQEIIRQILAKIRTVQQVSLSVCEIASLASYMKASRILTHARLDHEDEKEEALAYADGFLKELEAAMDLEDIDTKGLRLDLACNLLMLKRKGILNMHTSYSDVANFRRDGLISLDYCTLLYQWIRENTDIICDERDILSVYYVFSYFSKTRDIYFRKRVLVVSRYGMYSSRALAYQLTRMNKSGETIEWIPCEYLNIRNFDLGEIDCIATDIEGLQQEFPDKLVVGVHYFRTTEQINEVTRRINMPREKFRSEIFTPDDVIYADKIRNMASIEDLIQEEILLPEEDADLFIKEMQNHYHVYTPFRQNQLMILNTGRDVIGRDFLKVVIMKRPYKENDQLISAIIIYNVAGRRLERTSYIGERIARILHANGLAFTMDRMQDYELLCRLMYES